MSAHLTPAKVGRDCSRLWILVLSAVVLVSW